MRARRSAAFSSMVLTTVFALALGGMVAAPPAHAADASPFDIATGSRQRVADGWRDFGTPRQLTRIGFTSSASQVVSFEKYDWDAGDWVQFWSSGSAVSGSQTAQLDPSVEATKIRSPQSGVTITGVFNDSPLVATMNMEVTTTVGVPAVLPAKIDVDQADGGSVLVPVTWNPVDNMNYATAGQFNILGTYGSGDQTGTVTMKVTVTAERGLLDVPTPYLGWNSWYSQYMGVSEASIKEQVEIMEGQGLPAAGYDIIWIDEGWWGDSGQAGAVDSMWRDGNGNMVPNSKFPDMKAFADWLHARGLKLGMYTDTGDASCGGVWGSGGDNWFQQYRNDVAQFKAWGVDAIKLDHCGGHNDANQPANYQVYAGFYQAMRAEDPQGTMILDTCEWGQESPGDWAYKIAHAWRTGGDLGAPSLNASFYTYWNRNLSNGGSRPGGFNDPDYLVLTSGTPSQDPEMWRTQVSLWAYSASPMITSMDANLLTKEHIAILTNKDLLSIDQDPLVAQPNMIRQDATGLQVWSRPLADKNGKARRAIMLINETATSKTIGLDFSEAGLENVSAIRDVWDEVNVAPAESYSAPVFSNEVVLLIVEGDAITPTSGFAQYDYARLGKATASSSTGSPSSGRSQGAIDGDAGTYWQAHPSFADLDGSQWVAVDLTMERTVTQAEINLQTAVNTTSRLEYLDDSGVWQVAWTWASLPSGLTSVTLDQPVTAQQWRWRVPAGGAPQVRELALYGADRTATPGDLTGSLDNRVDYLAGCVAAPATGDVVASASTSWSGFGPNGACDGVNGTSDTGSGRWNSGTAGNNEWLQFTFANPVTDGGSLVISAGSFWRRQERTVVTYEDADGQWHPLATIVAGVTGPGPQAGELQGANEVSIDVTGLALKAIKLAFPLVNSNQPAANEQPYPSIWEVTLWSQALPDIVLVRGVNVSVRAGTALNLPDQVDVRRGDGSWEQADVVWDPVDPGRYDQYATDSFAVSGTVEGTSLPASAYVTIIPLPASLEDLQALVDANAGRSAQDYATDSWPAFEQALAAAQAGLAATPPPTATQIVDLAKTLQDAIDGLVDLRDLRQAVSGAEVALTMGACVDAGALAGLQGAVDAAQTVLAGPGATIANVADARAALADALATALERPNLALVATATSSSQYSAAYSASMVNDGDRAVTRWNASAGSTDGWVQLAWPSQVTANYVEIYFGQWSARAAQVLLEYQDSDGQWQTLATISTQPAAGQIKAAAVTRVPFQEAAFSHLRLHYVSTEAFNGGTDPSFFEIEVYNALVTQVANPTAPVVTTVGVSPVLPGELDVTLWNGLAVTSGVTWDPIPAGALDQPGSFELSGQVACAAGCQGKLAKVTVQVETGPVVVGLAQPVLSGTAVVGGTLSVSASASPEGAQVTCQWFRGTTFLSQASGTSYVVQSADAGQDLRVKVVASLEGAASVTRYSNTVTVADQIKVSKKVLPATGVVGDTLSLDLVFTPADAQASVQWFRGTTWIQGASGLSYTLAPADSGQSVVAKIVLSKDGYDPVTVYSTSTVVSGPVAPQVGSALLSPAGTVEVGQPLVLTYEVVPAGAQVKVEWFTGTSLFRVDGQPVTGTSYTPTSADVGKDLVVKLTVSVDGFASVVKYTNRVIVQDDL